jgi:Transmembrane protein 231
MYIGVCVTGLWQQLDTYNEQPNVHFQYEAIVIITTSASGNYVTWSTLQNYNQLQMNNLRIPTLMVIQSCLHYIPSMHLHFHGEQVIPSEYTIYAFIIIKQNTDCNL